MDGGRSVGQPSFLQLSNNFNVLLTSSAAKGINSNRSLDKMGKSAVDSFWLTTGFRQQGCVNIYIFQNSRAFDAKVPQ